jgi:hypothetical protein
MTSGYCGLGSILGRNDPNLVKWEYNSIAHYHEWQLAKLPRNLS